MTVDFNDYFWGEKNNGFDVLYHNMKFGLVASKELSEFFREKSNIEEQNSKLMTKLAHKASTGTLNSTFAPIWTILRTSAEKLSTLHLQMVHKLSELVKDVTKYADELHKKHKCVKEEESQTLECVQAMQASTAAVQKQRDLYMGKVAELEKLRKDNASHKDIEKIESKLKKLQDDYKALLDKHNPVKSEFERRMTQTCKRFQDIEELHLRQMREFLSTYLEMLQNNHDMVGQVHSDFKRQFVDMTVDKLLEQFVLNKYTGLEKPEVPEIDFVKLSIQQQSATSATRLNQLTTPSGAGAMSISSATNSNSATSLQGAMSRLAPSNAGGSTGEGVNDVSGSVGSGGSGSLLNADDSILGIMTSPRPNSPDPPTTSVSMKKSQSTTTPGTSQQQTATASQLTTTPSTTASTASSVKTNFRNWFSSSSSQNKTSASLSNSSINTTKNQATSSSNHPDTVNGASSTVSSGNFGTANNANGSSSTTTNTSTAIMKNNSLNSELQSMQDNNNQAKKQQQQIETENNSQQQKASVTSLSSSSSTNPSSISLLHQKPHQQHYHHHHHHHHASHQSQQQQQQHHSRHDNNQTQTQQKQQQQQQQQESQSEVQEKQNPTTAYRRASSLLNIFSANSQVSGILRSRREKAKTKKSKKKKDGESNENIHEENASSIDRSLGAAGSAGGAGNFQDFGKGQNSNHGSSGGDNLLSTANAKNDMSALGNVGSGTSGIGSILSGNGAGSMGAAGSSAGNGANSSNTQEVDEDGYSAQPAKEVAWEENRDNASFYSDSDSDSDNDKPERRIHVKIKPLNNGQAPMSASVDELRATVENISLSPTGVFSHSQQLQQTRAPSRQQSPEISNASTPTATVHPYAPLQSPTLSMSNNSRYADLGDIFSELGDVSSSAPASATLSKANGRQIPTPTSASSIAIPRPPSRRSEMAAAVAGRRNSPSPMNRADSVNSLEFRTAIGGIGSSRGPSPLTIGITDEIPLAVAFHEIVHAFFRGSDESRCQVKISGDMMISFPAGIAGLLANNPNPAKLAFRIKNTQNLENFVPNNKLVQIDRTQTTAFSTLLEFNMSALTAVLRRQAEHNPTASYFNVDILKYQVRSKPGASSCPFQLVCYWKCEPTFTALKIDYKYNSHAMASASPLLNVTLSVPVNGSVRNVQSKPHSAWLGESNRLVWNFTDISQNSQDGGVGTLRARLELNDGPSTPAILTANFNCEGTILSGLEFELHGGGYRLSLVKRRFVSGKYICEGDGILRSGSTPTPPSVGSSSPYSAKSN